MQDEQDLLHVSNCVFSHLRRAMRTVTQLYDDYLKPTGLKTTQCVLLATINAYGKSTVTKLADEMIMDQTSMTRALTILEKQGLIERVPDEADQRRRLISITPDGKRILDISLPLREQAQATMIERIGYDELGETVALLGQMTTAVSSK